MTTVLGAVAAASAGTGIEAFLVGGAVRDLLLGRVSSRDLDVVVLGGARAVEALASALRALDGFRAGPVHARFGTVSLCAPEGLSLDIAMARTETYPRPGSLPVVEPAAAIGDDLRRRDFTVNALAASILPGGHLGPLTDPFGGQLDLAARTLRLLHVSSLADDPTRALRGAHYAARLELAPEPGFADALARSREVVAWANVSGDRLRRGLELILEHPSAPRAVAFLRAWGVLDDIVPGWGEAAAAASRPEVDWSALVGAIPPRLREAVADRLRFSRRLRREVAA